MGQKGIEQMIGEASSGMFSTPAVGTLIGLADAVAIFVLSFKSLDDVRPDVRGQYSSNVQCKFAGKFATPSKPKPSEEGDSY